MLLGTLHFSALMLWRGLLYVVMICKLMNSYGISVTLHAPAATSKGM